MNPRVEYLHDAVNGGLLFESSLRSTSVTYRPFLNRGRYAVPLFVPPLPGFSSRNCILVSPLKQSSHSTTRPSAHIPPGAHACGARPRLGDPCSLHDAPRRGEQARSTPAGARSHQTGCAHTIAYARGRRQSEHHGYAKRRAARRLLTLELLQLILRLRVLRVG